MRFEFSGILYRFAVLALLMLPASVAWGNDLTLSRAALEDRTGKLSIDQVAIMTFQPMGILLAKGYSESAFWLKLQVKSPANGSEVVLRIRPTFLDDIKIYEPDHAHPGKWIMHVSGDRYPFDQRDRISVPFEFSVHPDRPYTTFYVRLKTTSSSLLFIQALTPHEAMQKDLNSDLFQIFFLSAMLVLLMLAAQDYLHTQDRVVIWYVLYQFIYIFYDLSVSGYLASLLPSDLSPAADLITSISAICTPFCAVLFFRELYKLYDTPPFLLGIFSALLLLLPIEAGLMMGHHVQTALRINSLSVFPILLFLPLMAFAARRENTPSRGMLRAVSSLQASTLLVFLFPIMGWSIGNVKAELILDATLIHGLLSALLMYVILHMRIQGKIRAARQTELELGLTRTKLEMRDERYREQGNFMAMLTHELKTSISAIRLILDLKKPTDNARQHAIQAVQDMDLLIERCLQSDRLEQASWKPHCQPCRMESLWEETQVSCASPERFNVVAETLPELNTDPQMLRIILGNLADNALKYSPPQAEIFVKMVPSFLGQRKGVCFTIENPPGSTSLPDPERVFSKYYRNPNAHSKTGSGLGLYLVEGFTRMLGGEISYLEVEGKARFALWIPG